jgi:hypothetical protein
MPRPTARCTACASSCRREVKPQRCIGESAPAQATARRVPAFGEQRGKGVPGQSTALHLRGRRVAPTALALQAAPARASRPLARRSRSTGSPASGLACSVLQPAAELAALTAFAALRQWRRVSSRSALARAAASPVLLGAPQARRGLPGHAFAGAFVRLYAREEPARQVVPAGGDLWSDEDRRTGVGARSALRRLTRRNCLSAVSEANAASSATRPRSENRSAVGAVRRPRSHEPSAGTAWRDAKAPTNPGAKAPSHGGATRAASSDFEEDAERRHCTARAPSPCRDHSSWRYLNG